MFNIYFATRQQIICKFFPLFIFCASCRFILHFRFYYNFTKQTFHFLSWKNNTILQIFMWIMCITPCIIHISLLLIAKKCGKLFFVLFPSKTFSAGFCAPCILPHSVKDSMLIFYIQTLIYKSSNKSITCNETGVLQNACYFHFATLLIFTIILN